MDAPLILGPSPLYIKRLNFSTFQTLSSFIPLHGPRDMADTELILTSILTT